VFEALHNRNFALFWMAAAISNAGNWMLTLTVPYIVYSLTMSGSWLGVAAAATFLPSLLGTVCIGALVDRYDRRRLLLVLQLVQMAAGALAWLVWAGGWATPLNMVFIGALTGFMGGMVNPSWNSFVPMLVPRELMASAIRMNSLQFALGRAFGPALTGAVLGPFGPGATLFINVVSFVVVIVVLIVVHPRTVATPQRGGSPVRQALDGWAYVFRHRSLAAVPICLFVSGFFGSSFIQLASAIAEEQFGRGRSAIGVIVGMFGLGSVVGSFLVSAFGDRVRRSNALFASLASWLIGLTLLGSSSNLVLGLAGLVFMGMAHVGTATTVTTALQMQVDEAYRGRASAAHTQGILLGVGLGAFALAQVAEATTLRTAELFGATAMAALAVIGARVFGRFRLLDSNTMAR
jgi:MFS family permease